MPNHVSIIKNRTFNECTSLSEVTLPDALTRLCVSAFGECESLRHIALPKDFESFDTSAFYCCDLQIDVHPDNQYFCFENGCLLDKAKGILYYGNNHALIPEGVHTICQSAFSGMKKLKKIVIPQSVKVIDRFAFSGCSSLVEVSIPDGLEKVGSWSFSGCPCEKEVLKKYEYKY